MARTDRFTPHLLAAAAALAASPPAWAQGSTTITVTGRAEPPSAIAGFGDMAPAALPISVGSFDARALADAGVGTLAALTKLDASLADAYNAEGYWTFLAARGYVLDNRYNYRRDGLPINAETALWLGNKDRVELLKGTSGLQAGTSAPGGIANLVVKRPTASFREVSFGWRERGSVGAAVDWSERFGPARAFGLRVNAEVERLRPATRAADGKAHGFALAADWQSDADRRLEFEFETSRREQPSVPGFSLLGDRVPDAASIDPRTNLNNQPWSLPVELSGRNASLRWQQRLASDWIGAARIATQRLESDDRIAFPFGCYDAAADLYYADRYCPDGSVDLYDFRSDGERRRVNALELRVDGRLATGPLQHRIGAGVLRSSARDRFGRQAFNFAGTGSIDGRTIVPAAPELTDENTNRDETATEFFVQDRVALAARTELWAGLRHSRLNRSSVRTDGSRATTYRQSFTTPWLALSHAVAPGTNLYASWGQGVESQVVPNRGTYTNAGQPLPALKSRQIELGLKHTGDAFDASAAWFDIRRPQVSDLCAELCTRSIDGSTRHRGVEIAAAFRVGAWSLGASAAWLDAKRQGAADPAANGLRPVNVPPRTLRLNAGWRSNGWHLNAAVVAEAERAALPDKSASIPGWARLDLAARWHQRWDGVETTARVGVDNATDRRAWRESPYQFGHAYLFPLASRTWRASLQLAF